MKIRYLSKIFWVIVLFVISNEIHSQNTLPDFSVNSAGKNKVIISWKNTYSNLVQVSVQRSYDSIKNFQTIFSAQSPELPGNGYSDNTVIASVKYYYRIFYVFDDGRYYFTKSKSATKTVDIVSQNIIANNPRIIINKTDTNLNKLLPEKFFYVYDRNKDSLLFVYDTLSFSRFKDSIVTRTKDTLNFLNDKEILLKQYNSLVWRPSVYLFSSERGDLKINLPLVKTHKYRIKIFDDEGNELFDIKNITEGQLYLEKGNFFHAGWFRFELFEDDKLKERNKFYLEKVF